MTAIRQFWEDIRDGTVWMVEVQGGQVQAAAGPINLAIHPQPTTVTVARPTGVLERGINERAHEFRLYRP